MKKLLSNESLLEKSKALEKIKEKVKTVATPFVIEKTSFIIQKEGSQTKVEGFSDATASNFWSSWGDR